MNIPDSPTALIRVGFFIGIGIGLAYGLFSVVLIVFFAIARGSVELFQWLTDFAPKTPWVGPTIGALFLVAAIVAVIYFTPIIKDQWIILRNKTR